MAISIQCPHCQSRLNAKDEKVIGRELPCPKCKKTFTVKAVAPTSPSTPSPPKPAAAKTAAKTATKLNAKPAAKPAAPALNETAVGDAARESEFGSDLGQTEDLGAFGEIDLGNLGPSISMPSPPAPTPAKSPAAATRGPSAPSKKKWIFIGAGGGSLLLVIAVVVGWLVFGSRPDQAAKQVTANPETATSNAATAAAAPSKTSSEMIESATLKKRLLELHAKKTKQSQPNATEADAENAMNKELAELARFREAIPFLMVTADQEKQLQAGQPLTNTKSRSTLLVKLFREFDLRFGLPPTIEPADLDREMNAVDQELSAHYLELGLIKLIMGLSDTNDIAQNQKKLTAIVRALREEDLSQMKSFEQLAGAAIGTASEEMKGTRSAAGIRTTAAARSLSNLKQIGLAFHNYHDVYRSFPAAVQSGPKNMPHSWRVSILPYLDGGKPLADSYRMDEPWDSPQNKLVLEKMPDVFRAPTDAAASSNTSYFGFTLDANVQGPSPVVSGTKGTRISDIRDGTSNVLLIVESKLPVPWTKPDDIPFDSQKPLPTIGGIHSGSFFTVRCDGLPIEISDSFSRDTLLQALLPADGEPVQLPGSQ